jgi:hypothetical protein
MAEVEETAPYDEQQQQQIQAEIQDETQDVVSEGTMIWETTNPWQHQMDIELPWPDSSDEGTIDLTSAHEIFFTSPASPDPSLPPPPPSPSSSSSS